VRSAEENALLDFVAARLAEQLTPRDQELLIEARDALESEEDPFASLSHVEEYERGRLMQNLAMGADLILGLAGRPV
jgi:hypothetical protein